MKKNLLSAALLVAGLFVGGHAFALEQDEAGVYQIGTAQDLIDFAALVNDNSSDDVDNTEACAVLTADIDLSDIVWIPIGCGDRKYKGTFDGQFHSIKNMTLRNVGEQGLFGVCESATIKYVTIDKSCTLRLTGDACASAFVGCCNGSGTLTIIGCTNYADVKGAKANNSAFVGCNYSGGSLKVEIIYCANYGNISGGWENGVFSGWFAGACKVYGSVNFGKITDHEGNLTLGRGQGSLQDYVNSYDLCADNTPNEQFVYADYTDAIAKSGQLCYELNCYDGFDGWFQNIGEDDFPTLDPTHKAVHAAGETYCDGTPKAAYTYTNADGATVKVDAHEFEGGFCKNCGAADPSFVTPDAEGFYPISNATELVWFAYMVNNGNPGMNAKLTADIDLKNVTWTSIGTDANRYCGTFDGQYYRIKNLVIDDPETEVRGFFGYIGAACVKHLIIDSSCSFYALKKTAAFAGVCNGEGTLVFEGCGNEADVIGISDSNGNNSAFIGCNYSSGALFVDMKYCWNTGNISGGNENGVFSGWFANAVSLTGCWNTGTITEGDGYNSLGRGLGEAAFSCTYDLNEDNLRQEYTVLSGYTSEMMSNGALCFALNGDQSTIGWYQTIGTDAQPVPDATHKQVYGKGSFYCDGLPKADVTYSNTEGGAIFDEHNYIDGFCDHCGKADPALAMEPDEEGYYHITTPLELSLFVKKVESDGTLKCKLDNDLDMDGVSYTPLGVNGAAFAGEFDGQNHKISNLIIDSPNDNSRGFIGMFTGGLIVRNLLLDETCSVTGAAYSAGIAGESTGSGEVLFSHVGNEATVTGTGANIAGIVGVNMSSGCHFVLECCYNTGTITGGNESAALSGWLGDNAVVTDCWNSGVITGIESGKPIARFGSATFTNCYTIEDYGQDNFTSFTYEDQESGALCWKLNGQVDGGDKWFQTLGEDYWPVPFSTHSKVYTAGSLLCDGSVDPDNFGYANEEGAVVRPDHEWENGICDVCGDADPTWKSADEDGWYTLADEQDLRWFAGMVKIGYNDIKARLSDDIDLSGIEWNPIGTSAYPFKGTFDGQCHYIDNLDVMGHEYAGFFGIVTGGADIKNVIVSGNVSGTRYVGGIAGGSNGDGTVKFTNVGNEATITAEEQNAAGIIGVSMGGSCAFIMNNCYNAGDVTGSRECAAFSGWMGKPESEIRNCYNIGTITGIDDGKPLYRYDAIQVSDLFCTNDDSQQGTVLSEDAVASGELAFYVNGKVGEGTHFFQTLGEDDFPVPFQEGHGTVYAHGTLLCDGSLNPDLLSFSNEPGEFEKADHQFGEDGCCELCGNAWGISTPEQLIDFSFNVQAYITNEADAYLLNDIDLKGIEWEPIGYGGTGSGTDECIPFAGTFDGQGHRILNMVIDDPTRQFLGFFGCLTGGAEVKNLTIDKSCYVRGDAYCAGFAGGSKLDGVILFENCGNECDVVCDGSNGANAAGFVGCNMNSSATFIIKNCFNTGDIKGGLESASFSGWLGSNATVTNCWNTGTIEGIESGKPFARFSSATFNNCYDLAGSQTNVERLTASAVTTGELCYHLNEGNTEDPIWRQTIGTDPYPIFAETSGIVYRTADYEYTNDPAGNHVESLTADPEATVSTVYTLQGVQTNEMQRGINIVRMSDGTVRKVLVK